MSSYKEFLNDYKDLLNRLKDYQNKKIPLCAAETYVSDLVRSALSSEFEGKYCMNYLDYDENNDFIGSKYIHELFCLVNEQCKKMFGSKYADARTLSGMNCLSITINSLLTPNDKVLLTTGEQGGHPSVPLLLFLANIEYDSIPYDYQNNDIDYARLNRLLQKNKYRALIFAQSDVISPADLSKIEFTDELVIYDATQTFGMISVGLINNPLKAYENVVLIGGTHKTLPGPTSGLILVDNEKIINKISKKISPSYLRNVQPNNIAGVLLSLIEQECFGKEYQAKTIENANYLACKLEELGFYLAKTKEGKYTHTHQLFIYTTKEEMDNIFHNARLFNITLNKKEKKLFRNYGIRLGLQEITRYGWNEKELDIIAKILKEIIIENPNKKKVIELIDNLPKEKRCLYNLE